MTNSLALYKDWVWKSSPGESQVIPIRDTIGRFCLQSSLRVHRRGKGTKQESNLNKSIRLRPLPSGHLWTCRRAKRDSWGSHYWYPETWLRGHQICISVQGLDRWKEKYLRSERGGRIHRTMQLAWPLAQMQGLCVCTEGTSSTEWGRDSQEHVEGCTRS